MDAIVRRPDGSQYLVKNMGWLLRRLARTQAVQIEVESVHSDDVHGSQWLTVRLADGFTFYATFGSSVVLSDWLITRRSLREVPTKWHGRQFGRDWWRVVRAARGR